MYIARLFFILFTCLLPLMASAQNAEALDNSLKIPKFIVDPFWPKKLPAQDLLGQVAGISVDKDNHIWIIQRPRSLTQYELGATLKPPASICCKPMPPVIEFDQEGNILQAWGGPGAGYDWPKVEHGIYVDPKGNVWIAGASRDDRMVLKFSNKGKFLLQIGTPGLKQSNNDTKNLGRPTNMILDLPANEIYVSDGYQNRRVIVFDADTGMYKRQWGAYGNKPIDGSFPNFNPQSSQFGNPVHCVRILNDGLVYVCDRANDRIQIFTKSGQFIKQMIIDPKTRGEFPLGRIFGGSTWDIVPSEDKEKKYLFIPDGMNNEVKIVLRETGEKIGSFGRSGRMAGDFHMVHSIAIDSLGNLYTTETDNGKRIQKFIRTQ